MTYRDGIVLDIGSDFGDTITYRRGKYKKKDLKQSLLYSLMSLTDEVIATVPVLNWEESKPSRWFGGIKEHYNTHSQGSPRVHSPLRAPPPMLARQSPSPGSSPQLL